jgi:hypothetical protein
MNSTLATVARTSEPSADLTMADLNDAQLGDEPIEMDDLVDKQSIRTALINKLGKARSNALKKGADRLVLLGKVAKDDGRCFHRSFAESNTEMITAFVASCRIAQLCLDIDFLREPP